MNFPAAIRGVSKRNCAKAAPASTLKSLNSIHKVNSVNPDPEIYRYRRQGSFRPDSGDSVNTQCRIAAEILGEMPKAFDLWHNLACVKRMLDLNGFKGELNEGTKSTPFPRFA